MKDSFKRQSADLRRKLSAANYASALAAVDEMLKDWPGSSALLLRRAELIQLQDEDGPALSEAKQALQQAVERDENSVEALCELGQFQFSVEDDAGAAEESFERAIELATKQLISALVGKAAA